ncbi:LAME_0G06590g1_1 [Lachancea meyersii CBS 8951]|uniref:LAME_0G06590g1_1 n=1 Tax=Lachancea meyersii CBS 8951 TaxID=1266667 RepID=A0A1G4K7M5_9SACH|nr:LAME_0G06590g1_1 [Lachancea meyersii CBS 8951]
MLVDLNVPWPQTNFQETVSEKQIQDVTRILETLHTLGYTHVALNFSINHTEKFPTSLKELNPIRIQEYFGSLIQATGLKLYSRITLIIDDPSKGQSLSKISQAFDIVAALPISEKALTLATSSLDVDLLTFQYKQRLPAFLKHKSICSCVARGVKLEIVYAHALRDMQTRRQFIQNVKSVVRSSRSRGIVISSGATKPVECRNVLGVTCLIKIMGLQSDKCMKAMTDLPALVLLNGRLRTKSHKQTVVIGGGSDSDIVNESDIDPGKLIKIVKRRVSESSDDNQPNKMARSES